MSEITPDLTLKARREQAVAHFREWLKARPTMRDCVEIAPILGRSRLILGDLRLVNEELHATSGQLNLAMAFLNQAENEREAPILVDRHGIYYWRLAASISDIERRNLKVCVLEKAAAIASGHVSETARQIEHEIRSLIASIEQNTETV